MDNKQNDVSSSEFMYFNDMKQLEGKKVNVALAASCFTVSFNF